jgi:hypothetical protein
MAERAVLVGDCPDISVYHQCKVGLHKMPNIYYD